MEWRGWRRAIPGWGHRRHIRAPPCQRELVATSIEVPYLSALELRELDRARSLSPVEVVTEVLERIEQLNPRYTAFITVTAELAVRQARQSEARYAAGEPNGSLDGIPISIKDLM